MSKKLEEFSISELEDIIVQRKLHEQKPVPVQLPRAVQDEAWGNLVRVCRAYIDQLADPKGKRDPEDQEHYIFEKALELVYGGRIWGWVKEANK